MREFTLIIPPELDGKELKYILRSRLALSAGAVTRLKKSGGITLCGRAEYVTKRAAAGDILRVVFHDTPSENITPEPIPLEILFEDEDVLAVNKPAGMPTHPSARHHSGTLANAVCAYLGGCTFRAVTRLDRYTSGVVITAKNEVSAARMSDTMKSGGFTKEYAALCVGTPKPERGIIDAPIARCEGIIKRCVSPSGKNALSEYEVISEHGGLSLVRLRPKTGRTHQLRVHLAYIGTPIYGDFLYGREIPGERIRLHCKSVSFPHPITGRKITVCAPLPADMQPESVH